jgi:hypothetical protein
MSLNDELKALRARAESKRPPEIVAAMHRAVDELRASGAPGRVLKVGDPAPRFALPNADGRIIDSTTLLAAGWNRSGAGGRHVLSGPLVTVLQRRAGSSTECPVHDHAARGVAGGHLTPAAGAQS